MDSLANRGFSFDIGTLLTPISERQPSGESLRYDPLFDRIRESRREDDAVQERGVWKMTLKKADWDIVESLCIETLEKRTKDLQVAAWLVEAWLRLYGLPGLRDGFRLLNALSAAFWDTIHPLPDEGDIEYRVAPFEWANEKLPVILKLVPITNPPAERARTFCLADWENACRPRVVDPRKRYDPPDPNLITQDVFTESVTLTSTEDLTVLLELTDAALLALNKLNATLDEKCAGHSPGLGQISTVLGSIRTLLYGPLSSRPKAEVELEVHDSGGADLSEAPVVVRSEPGSGPIRSRADAYRRLTEAADFLARTEPHSPVPYLVKRAIGWGNLKLEDLLPELVRNSSELSEIYRLLQIGNSE
jgi:type VI secretion system protein ImpA